MMLATISVGTSNESIKMGTVSRVQFSGGRGKTADILVGADGIRSSVRAQPAPEIKPVYAGYYIWRGAPNEVDLDPETRRTIYPLFTFYLLKNQQVVPSSPSHRCASVTPSWVRHRGRLPKRQQRRRVTKHDRHYTTLAFNSR